MAQLLKNDILLDVTSEDPTATIKRKVNATGREDKDDAFFIADLGDVVKKYKLWVDHLPRVQPFYAVKCNEDPGVLATLAELGCGFDCASKLEIQTILDLNVSPDRIVYANPCKQNSYIRYAASRQVHMMTFDNECELHKIKVNFPGAKLIIRIAPPDESKSDCPLGMKYGCAMKTVPQLLRVARELGLSVIGVSFHVGSGCYDGMAYSAALAASRTVFDIGEKNGFRFSILDIGGGFPGQQSAKVSFEEIAAVIRPALDTYFPESMGVRLIAEPGRFFVASAFTLVTNVIARRTTPRDETSTGEHNVTGNEEAQCMYYINDGLYGTFNCLLYDNAATTLKPTLLGAYEDEPSFTSSIWGPTCDGLDCIMEEVLLPELYIGDWIIFQEIGAYTMCAASNFNGMPKPRCYYVMRDANWMLFHVFKDSAAGDNSAHTNLKCGDKLIDETNNCQSQTP